MQVEAHLRGQNLDKNDNVNANKMQALAKVVATRITAARRAKQAPKVTVKPPDKEVTVVDLIPAYIELGFQEALRGGRKQKDGKKPETARTTEQAAWDEILGAGTDEAEPAE